ncbi:MAG: hypothetical protein AB4290_05210 [Spirulina sp.]
MLELINSEDRLPLIGKISGSLSQIIPIISAKTNIEEDEQMSQVMTFQEMEQKYEGQWLLIAYTDIDEEMQIKEGTILAHSRDKEKIYQALESIKNIPVAIEHAGKFTENLDYIL